MSEFKLTVTHNGIIGKAQITDGESFLSALRNADYSGINAPCGGNGTCGQCRIRVTGKVKSPGEGCRSLEDEEILACRYTAASDCEVLIPEISRMEVVTGGAGDIKPEGTGLGAAVDIGTTTVAAFLYDMQTGHQLAVVSGRNAQRAYGADVISRIQFSDTEGGLDKLRNAVRRQIDEALNKLCEKSGRQRRDITMISIAGNTVMEHIFDDLSPVSIGVAPFETLSLFGCEKPGGDYFDGLSRDSVLYLAPALAGYVGGDITAGLLSSDAWQNENTCLFIDIGTNGEMGIGDKNGYTCCATAAGPAFEGAEIECGMDASEGAINIVRYVGGRVEFETIGGTKAKGICGSGLIDALSVMLRCGGVEESGRMVPPEDAPENIAAHLKEDERGKMRFYFTEDVYVSAEDVRQLQLAKSAIRAGIETLIEMRNKSTDEIGSVLIAGGFGAFMDVTSACAIGLLPPAFKNKTVHVGNAAGAGAALTLNSEVRQQLAEFSRKCDYHELSSSPMFMEKYIECMIFDEVFDIYPEI